MKLPLLLKEGLGEVAINILFSPSSLSFEICFLKDKGEKRILIATPLYLPFRRGEK